ncbi:MAG: hypothetical protein A2086_08015 [Spirochaetes bacterium GWD1_27_9]|nr:MAG: hypothetical protein A2Z98_07145 [Spirochaetes bacterium GWB1_27_13]OHD25155.1 MAG: hypothetical protein A2Y34_16845 [Spirochaetes bacterium GWC1_27_15]OHD34467.1 MAG: hypothetical protein A2086_08015 [Spirochaetes bacterium GWD1_27_9]
MLNQKELEKNTLAELKSIADDKELDYDKKVKKDDLIKLILESEKVIETANQKKEDLKDNPTSQTSSGFQKPQEQKQDFFYNVPNLPQVYGKNKIVFMVRDPYWGFVYWELTKDLINQHNLSGIDRFLRIYDITNSGSPESESGFFDIKINDVADNWYIKFPYPNKTYQIDLGYFKDGKFITLVRSNVATTPRDDLSDQIDVEWMMSEDQFKKILQASGADQLFQQSGSQELMKFLAGNILEGNETTSGLIPNSFSSTILGGSSSSTVTSSFARKN